MTTENATATTESTSGSNGSDKKETVYGKGGAALGKVKSKRKSKGKPAKAKAAKTEKLINTAQRWILKTLARCTAPGGLTRREIADRAGKAGCATSRGRISDEAGNYLTLEKIGYIRFHDVPLDGVSEWRYTITPTGRKEINS